MATVRDPDFWKRFSVAVHQDEAEKEMAKLPNAQHAYVKFPSASPSPVTTPTSQSPLSPALQPLSPITLQTFGPSKPAGPLAHPQSPKTPMSPSTPSSTATMPKRHPSRLTKPQPAKANPSPVHNPFTRQNNPSLLSLGLSGRPQSRFKFWTDVSADPSNRTSWLVSQQKKRRQRTWMCWLFWGIFVGLIAGIAVAILVLKAKDVI